MSFHHGPPTGPRGWVPESDPNEGSDANVPPQTPLGEPPGIVSNEASSTATKKRRIIRNRYAIGSGTPTTGVTTPAEAGPSESNSTSIIEHGSGSPGPSSMGDFSAVEDDHSSVAVETVQKTSSRRPRTPTGPRRAGMNGDRSSSESLVPSRTASTHVSPARESSSHTTPDVPENVNLGSESRNKGKRKAEEASGSSSAQASHTNIKSGQRSTTSGDTGDPIDAYPLHDPPPHKRPKINSIPTGPRSHAHGHAERPTAPPLQSASLSSTRGIDTSFEGIPTGPRSRSIPSSVTSSSKINHLSPTPVTSFPSVATPTQHTPGSLDSSTARTSGSSARMKSTPTTTTTTIAPRPDYHTRQVHDSLYYHENERGSGYDEHHPPAPTHPRRLPVAAQHTDNAWSSRERDGSAFCDDTHGERVQNGVDAYEEELESARVERLRLEGVVGELEKKVRDQAGAMRELEERLAQTEKDWKRKAKARVAEIEGKLKREYRDKQEQWEERSMRDMQTWKESVEAVVREEVKAEVEGEKEFRLRRENERLREVEFRNVRELKSLESAWMEAIQEKEVVDKEVVELRKEVRALRGLDATE